MGAQTLPSANFDLTEQNQGAAKLLTISRGRLRTFFLLRQSVQLTPLVNSVNNFPLPDLPFCGESTLARCW